ncbi:hypothetical protein CHS0354_024697 [Potamilus streckersoni]|uniref:C2H2-type domain-containing protein n=1 Tax=Potamilus streckersoni TaxID=2493646 RepID=A0AAE0RXA6_9BIVA|nr:hypothetical protein CHS0354_024697 [Potamilus streckersoni]
MDSNHIGRPGQPVEEADHKSSEEISNKCTSSNSIASKKSLGNLDISADGNRADVIGLKTGNILNQTDSNAMKAVPSNALKDSNNSYSDLTSEDELKGTKDWDGRINKTGEVQADEGAVEQSFMAMNENRCQENKEHLLCDYNIVENKNLYVDSEIQDGTSHLKFEPESQHQHHPPVSVEICGTNFKALINTGEVQTNDVYGNFADKGNPLTIKADHELMENLSGTDLKSSFSWTINNEMRLSSLPEVKVVLVDVMKMPIIQSFFSVGSTNDILQTQKKGRPKRCGDQGFIGISGIDPKAVSKNISQARNEGAQNKKAKEILNTKKKKGVEQVISERVKTDQQITSNNLNEQGQNILTSSADQISLKRKVKTKSFLKESARQKIMKELEGVADKKNVSKVDSNGEKCSRTRKTEKSSVLNIANLTEDYVGNGLQNDAVEEEEDVFEDSGEEYIDSSEDEYLPSKEKIKSKGHFVNSFSRKKRQNIQLANCSSKLKFITKGKSKRIGRPPVLGLFYCKHCDFTATEKNLILKHHARVHVQPFLNCNYCNFTCRSRSVLMEHEARKHTNEKPFKCQVEGCEYASKCKTDLDRHQSKHATEKIHKCPHCDFTTKWRRNIRHHLMTHTTDRPFSCDICGFSFKRYQDLSTEDRPFRCPICPYGAKIAHHLLAHIGSEHGDSYAYFCELCKKPFKRYGQLQTHYKRMHSKQELDKLGDLDPARLKVELKAERREPSEDIKDNEEKAMGMDLLNCIKEEPSGADKDEILEQVVAELEGSHTQTKSSAYGQRDTAESNTELQKEKKKGRGRPKKKGPNKIHIDICVGSPVVLDEDSQDYQSSSAKNEGKIAGSVIVQTEHNDIDQKADSDEKNKEKEDTSCNVKDDADFVTQENIDEANEDTNGETQIMGNTFDKMVLNHARTCNIETTKNEGNTESKTNEVIKYTQNIKEAISSNSEIKPLKEEMKLASTVDDDKSSETSKPAATLAMYDGFRLPLATKGFEFNFEKTGKKPECWFMDPNLMNKKDAARHRAYLRKRGLTAATIRTREKNRRANPRQVALFTGFKSRHHDKYKTYDRKELMKKYFGRATDTMEDENTELLDKTNAWIDKRTHSKDLEHPKTTVKKKNDFSATTVKKHKSHRVLKKKEINKNNIIFETLEGKNLSEKQVQQSFPLLLSQCYSSEGISTTKKKTKYSEAKKLKQRKKRALSIDGKTFKEKGVAVQEKKRGNDNLIWKQPQKKKGKTKMKMSAEKGNKPNRHEGKEKKSQSKTHSEENVCSDPFSIIQNIAGLDDVDDEEENIPLSRLASVNKIGENFAPCQTPEKGQNPDGVASDVLNVKLKKRSCTKTKSRDTEAKNNSAKKGHKTHLGHGISEKRKIGEESSMEPRRKKMIKKSDASDMPRIIRRTQKNGAKTKTKQSLKKLKKLKIKISLPSKKVLSSESTTEASKRKKANKRTKKGPLNTYFPIENSQYVVVYPPIGVSLENTVIRGKGKGAKGKTPVGNHISLKDQTQLVLFESCIKSEPDGQFLPDSSYLHPSEPDKFVQPDQSQVTQVIVKDEVQSVQTAVTYPYQDLAEEWRRVQNESMPAKSVHGGTDVVLDLSGYKADSFGCPMDKSSPFGSLMDKAAAKDSHMEDSAQDAPLDLSCKNSNNSLNRGDISGTGLLEINSSDFADQELKQQQYSVVVKKEPDMEDSFFTSLSGSQQE